MGMRGTFLADPGDLRPRLQVKGHVSLPRVHHRGWRSGVSFT